MPFSGGKTSFFCIKKNQKKQNKKKRNNKNNKN